VKTAYFQSEPGCSFAERSSVFVGRSSFVVLKEKSLIFCFPLKRSSYGGAGGESWQGISRGRELKFKPVIYTGVRKIK